MNKFLRGSLDREPIVVLSCILGGIGLGLPLVVPAMRRSMGMNTNQYYTPAEQYQKPK